MGLMGQRALMNSKKQFFNAKEWEFTNELSLDCVFPSELIIKRILSGEEQKNGCQIIKLKVIKVKDGKIKKAKTSKGEIKNGKWVI